MSTEVGSWDIATSVGLTALVVSAARAIESERPDGLVDDPLATQFVAAASDAPVALPTTPADPAADTPLWRALTDMLALRSRHLDDAVRDAVDAGITQVVVLAAGLDVRAHRLPALARATTWEVDQPAVLSFKQQVLDAAGATPYGDRRTVAIDLRGPWSSALADAGHDPTRPTLWLAEGLLPYLPAAAETALIEQVTAASAPGSRAAVEFILDPVAVRRSPLFAVSGSETGADFFDLFDRGERAPATDVFEHSGWRTSTETMGDLAARLGRRPDDAADEILRHGVLLEARR